ncbi:MAG: hypothetical protein M3014_12460, partial [Chloroflexota bacterium]|nr:hypothetical protein [Chloroflexota bacterium]
GGTGGGTGGTGGGTGGTGGGTGGTGGGKASCDLTGGHDSAVDNADIRAGATIKIKVYGFTQDEPISYWFTLPGGSVLGTAHPIDPAYIDYNGDGSIGPLSLQTDASFAQAPGRWALTFQGAYSHHQAVAYFCIHP